MTDAEKQLTEDMNVALGKYYAATGQETFITHWIIVTSEIDPSFENRSGVGMLYPGGQMNWVQAIGMIEAAKLRLGAEYTSWGRDE